MDEFNNIDRTGDIPEFEKPEVEENINDANIEDTAFVPETIIEDSTENPQKDSFLENTTENDNIDDVPPPFIPPYNPINYTPVVAVEDKKTISRGLKFFCLLIAFVIILSVTCTAGYFLGRNSSGGGYIGKDVTVGLEAKPADTDEMTAAQVYEKANPSVVGICVYNSSGKAANASGVIYSNDGYIVTNDHIYSEVGEAKFKVYTYDGKEYDAEYVAGDKISDLAVLKIKSGEFQKAEFGNSEQLIYGENVVAIGRPGGASNSSSITKGIISATSRRVQTTSNYSSRLIETDCPINPGSSGGALINMYGQVIGITSSKLASEDIDAVGYAIPTTTMKRIVEELIKSGKVLSRAKLGITYVAIDSVAVSIGNYKYEGLYVESVAEDSDLYGKISKGQIITHINDIKVTSDEIVLDIIEKAKAGDTIKVTVVNEQGESTVINAILKANVSESSYSEIDSQKNDLPNFSGDNNNGGAFNFPFGE